MALMTLAMQRYLWWGYGSCPVCVCVRIHMVEVLGF